LTIVGNPRHGVLLQYVKAGAGRRDVYYSKGDLKRLREWVETKHGDLMPIGLFIPFEQAWSAVKEFIETVPFRKALRGSGVTTFRPTRFPTQQNRAPADDRAGRPTRWLRDLRAVRIQVSSTWSLLRYVGLGLGNPTVTFR
jgi:hypothetical protein